MKKGQIGVGANIYKMRVIGWLLANINVLLANDRTTWSEPAIWVPLVFFTLYPHVSFLLYRLRGSLRRAEFVNLTADMILIGLLAGLLHFNPVIALPYAIANSAANYSIRGVKLLLRGLVAWLLGLALALLLFDFQLHAGIQLLELLPCFLYLTLTTHYIGYISYSRGLARLKAKEKVERADRAKGEFLANMGHEIRTPMNAIIGLVDLCWRSELSPSLRDRISRIRSSSFALLAVIDDVLNFSRLEGHRIRLEQSTFDVRALLEQLTDLVGQTASGGGLDFIVEVDPAVPAYLIGDSRSLVQILSNLVNNALKFTSKGEVVIRVRVIGDTEGEVVRLRFSVADTGIGIPSEVTAKVFEAFTQADGSTTRKYGGPGLGLAIVDRLVALMGGQLDVDSKVDYGSTFAFEIDLERSSGEDQEPRPSASPELQQRRVLVVDNNPRARAALEEMLTSMSFITITTGDARSALILLAESNDIGLVLIDWSLPGMNGIELARRIADARPEITRIVLLRPQDREAAVAASGDGGVQAIITRPFGPSRLLQHILSAGDPKNLRPEGASIRTVEGLDRISGARVLVAEDNETNRLVVRSFLEGAGVEVEVVASGNDAIIAVTRKRFDAVLMDLHMPETDGIDATLEIRRNPHLHDLPIIALTADTRTETRDRALEVGMNAMVKKPFDSAVLLETLVRWIDLPEDRRRNTSHAAKTETTELPVDLPGINVRDALKRIGGRHDLLREALRSFARSFGGTGDDLIEYLRRSDTERTLELLHRLKGAAGNLSATLLYAACVKLENCVRANCAEVKKLLDEVVVELGTVVATCSGLAVTPEEPAPSFDLASIREQIDELVALLDRRSLRARKL